MNRHYAIANSILWTAAIIAAAILRAPTTLCLIVLPSLAVLSVLIIPSLVAKTRGRDLTTRSSVP